MSEKYKDSIWCEEIIETRRYHTEYKEAYLFVADSASSLSLCYFRKICKNDIFLL